MSEEKEKIVNEKIAQLLKSFFEKEMNEQIEMAKCLSVVTRMKDLIPSFAQAENDETMFKDIEDWFNAYVQNRENADNLLFELSQ